VLEWEGKRGEEHFMLEEFSKEDADGPGAAFTSAHGGEPGKGKGGWGQYGRARLCRRRSEVGKGRFSLQVAGSVDWRLGFGKGGGYGGKRRKGET